MEDMLKLRKEKKDKKPDFVRQQGRNVGKLEEKWRQPKGLQSKLRRKFRDHGKHPSMGYSSPKAVRELDRFGRKEVIVNNPAEVSDVKEGEVAVIASNVGKRKTVEILKKAAEMKVTVSNVKDPEGFIKKVEESLKKRKEDAKTREDKNRGNKRGS